MTKQFDPEYQEDLEIFLTETQELLSYTEQNLVELEKAPGDAGLIQEVFRAMHTIKGGAATLGLQQAVDVTHRMESVLDEVRSGKSALSPGVMDGLLAAVDWLGRWKTAMEEGSPAPPVEGALPGVDGTHLLRVELEPATPLLSVRCFQILTLVEEVAHVLGSIPSLDDIENDRVENILEVYVVGSEACSRAQDVIGSVQGVKKVVSGPANSPPPSLAVPQQDPEDRSAQVRIEKTTLGKTVRVQTELLDFLLNMIGELVIDRARLGEIASRLFQNPQTQAAGSELNSLASRLQTTGRELQMGIMQARLLPLKSIFSKFPRMVRDLSRQCGKEIQLKMAGERTELDRTVIEAVDDPLIHLIRNAVDHGIEMPEDRQRKGKSRVGTVSLSAWHEDNQVLIRIEDDGRGIDPEKTKETAMRKGLVTPEVADKLTAKDAVELVFMPGFSTAQVATTVSGRGVGMDVVRANLERVGGQVELDTAQGHWTRVTLKLPLTLAIIRALLVKCEDFVYAIPTSSVEEVLRLKSTRVRQVHGKPTVRSRGQVVPLVSLANVLQESDPWSYEGRRYALLTKSDHRPLALAVDDLIGEEEIVVKEMKAPLSRLKGIAGATILAKGDPAIILDVNRIM